jgi:hypothetical protein
MTPPTIIQNIAHYGHGDIYAQQNAGDRVQADLLGYALWAGGAVIVGGALYGLALGAVAFGTMVAPYVLAVGGSAAVGIGGVTVWQRRLLKQAATVQPALPLPTFDYKALPSEMRSFAADYYAHTGRHLSQGQLEALEMQLVAHQLKTQCASLPSPSESSPLPASRLVQSC